ncbi:MAG: starch-binding protein [Bacteroidetes bacterium GWF2_42_66]|nr:MAG: starch-binding protein [Bacteroidetes bacterium GWA2_42_15]OFX96517.1 MAG: starch-binding protein [Bacteroidetes bacterium GWE2_42_39]OFY40937.1 MAG: starch-binding protein [Bacteroidetes bacterium GWF2_42_66]HAZ02119.1 RagB/SusD family nutrient uptake outer membrane protein [Marinilabiliales bacterium]HBL76374.1 RagB/SusD family nutrient uptake outer membrane protein [Prolixibacteraceae bacterium]
MKKIYSKILFAFVICELLLSAASCTKDILEQEPTVNLGASSFWKTEDDATYALMGAYSAVRGLFDRDYYFDGQGEFFRTRSSSNSTTSGNINLGGAYRGGSYAPAPGNGSGFDAMYQFLYGGVNRTNYVIENVNKMLLVARPASVANLEAIIGEARLLRGMVYFRLISLWGDVPYFSKIINENSEISDIARMPITQIKDSIMADFTYAFEKLPVKATQIGRASKPAALAFRGKFQLYWACWNKNGWPELDTFTSNATAATEAYKAAAADFKAVIENYGLNLFRNGEPGDWGTMGNAEVLPNYYYMFIPSTGNPNTEGEMIMVFTHGGTGSGQSEELMRDFAGRSHEGSQLWVMPRFEIANRYQSTVTGDFCTPLIPMSSNTAGRAALNSAVNPQSYANRDYRMKATIMWDYEMSKGLSGLAETGWRPFIYKTWAAAVNINGNIYTSYDITSSAATTGIVFRKFLRNYAGLARSEGDYNWPVMRLADVYLMYAEASNEAYGPQADAIALVNKIRHRGNLPALAASKTASKDVFFSAIEQERIIELFGEGQRPFDLRRWRAIERVFGAPYSNGIVRQDTNGGNQVFYFKNASELGYQQCYIFKIPQAERERNPNLTQNKPWM